MKRLAYILFLFVLFSCTTENVSPDAKNSDKPVIKSTVEKIYSMVLIDGKLQKDVFAWDEETRFDNKGRITESSVYEYGEKDPTRTVYTYPTNDTFEYIQYGKRGLVYIRCSGKLNSNGSPTEQTITFQDFAQKIKTEYTYNNKNQVIKDVSYIAFGNESFEKSSFSTYEYDSDGNLIKLIETSYDDNKAYESTYSYQEFDKHKNWTLMIQKSNGINHLSERTIEYYQ